MQCPCIYSVLLTMFVDIISYSCLFQYHSVHFYPDASPQQRAAALRGAVKPTAVLRAAITAAAAALVACAHASAAADRSSPRCVLDVVKFAL